MMQILFYLSIFTAVGGELSSSPTNICSYSILLWYLTIFVWEIPEFFGFFKGNIFLMLLFALFFFLRCKFLRELPM